MDQVKSPVISLSLWNIDNQPVIHSTGRMLATEQSNMAAKL